MTNYLLDANALIALTIAEHEDHDAAQLWFAGGDRVWICPIVEGALLRVLLRVGERGSDAATILAEIHRHQRVEFLAEDLSYREVPLAPLRGHRQVTDAYLVALAAARGMKLATFDQALSKRHPDSAHLIPSV